MASVNASQLQLISATDDWANVLNKRRQTDVALLDFSKAFDKVPHRLLVAKLKTAKR